MEITRCLELTFPNWKLQISLSLSLCLGRQFLELLLDWNLIQFCLKITLAGSQGVAQSFIQIISFTFKIYDLHINRMNILFSHKKHPCLLADFSLIPFDFIFFLNFSLNLLHLIICIDQGKTSYSKIVLVCLSVCLSVCFFLSSPVRYFIAP